MSVEGNSSSANSYTDVTSSKSETLADASCHSIVNSPPPSSKSSPRSHNPSRLRMSPCFKIVSTARKPNTDFPQMKPPKPTKKSNLLDVEKMYVEFIRAFERSQPRHKAFTGPVAAEVTEAKSPVREPYRGTSDTRDFATTADFHGGQSSRHSSPPENHACAPYTGYFQILVVFWVHFFLARHCSSHCGTPSPPAPAHPEGHPCACARICKSTPLYSCRGFQLSCTCNCNTGDAHNANRMHYFSPHGCYYYNNHHRGQHYGPSRFDYPPHTGLCQEGISPHYNNSYFNARDGLSAAANQTDCRQPSNTNEPSPASLQIKAMPQSVALERPVRESAERRQQCAPSHCAQADAGKTIPSSAPTSLANPTHGINNGFIKVSEGAFLFLFVFAVHA
ncbi:unnamed protein product [Taenia asiatica]|uniref:Uncharacterized protein n=1 Tax=Taenia asiatica TaxID=60517 RepID=A0A3P6PUQ5_TAEAS|nr:unnamed protein product [Taenia asiatica]